MLQRYNPILNAIRDLCPTAHIGGGAVRDTLLERPIRDIDLFLDEFATDERGKAAAVEVQLRQSRRMEVATRCSPIPPWCGWPSSRRPTRPSRSA